MEENKKADLSSIPQPPQDKLEVLKKIFDEATIGGYPKGTSPEMFLYHAKYDSFAEFKDQNQSLISSLFSPAAQPIGDKPDDVIRKEGDTLLTELKKDKNHITKQLNHKNIISYNTGFHTGYMLGYKAKPQPANEPVVEPTGNWDELERRVTDEITALEGLKRPASISGLEQVLAWIGELRRQTSSKEPAPTAEDWEKEFEQHFYNPEYWKSVGIPVKEIVSWIKSNVPKVVVGGDLVMEIATAVAEHAVRYYRPDYNILGSVKQWLPAGRHDTFVSTKTIYDKWAETDIGLDLTSKLSTSLSSLIEQVSQLESWKKQAIAVMPDMQAIGKAIGVRLGESVHDKILPAIEKYKGEISRLVELLKEQFTSNAFFDATNNGMSSKVAGEQANNEWSDFCKEHNIEQNDETSVATGDAKSNDAG